MSRPVDEFGDRMKAYEAVETERRLDPHLPIYARIDGRAFSTFTRGMARPYEIHGRAGVARHKPDMQKAPLPVKAGAREGAKMEDSDNVQAEATTGSPRNVYFWQNGMVMTFDVSGQQMPDLQGRDTPDLREAIKRRADDDTVYHGGMVWPRGGLADYGGTREGEELAEQAKAEALADPNIVNPIVLRCQRPCNVAELREALATLPDDMPVVFVNFEGGVEDIYGAAVVSFRKDGKILIEDALGDVKLVKLLDYET